MIIKIDDRDVCVSDADITIARASVDAFFETIRQGCEDKGDDALFLTTLIMAYQRSSELLNKFDKSAICYLLNRSYERRKRFLESQEE